MAFRLLVFLLSASLVSSQKSEGDSCVDEYTNSVGRCTRAEACQSAQTSFQQNGIRPTFCAYTFDGALVCCRDGGNILQAPKPPPAAGDVPPVWSNNRPNDGRRVSERSSPGSRITEVRWYSLHCNYLIAKSWIMVKADPGPSFSRAQTGHYREDDSFIERYIECEQYSRGVVQNVDFIPLVPDPDTMSIKTAKCGYTGVELIVGGERASLGEFPHMAAIGWAADNGYAFKCGGSLISPRFVLTAGHCTRDPSSQNPAPVVVRLGDQNINPAVYDGASPVEVPIKRIIKHPNYKPPVRYNDIALLELATNVDFEANVRPACLWPGPAFGGHEKGIATGWGVADPVTRRAADELQKVSLSLLENSYCNPLLSDTWNRNWKGFAETQMCAGELRGGKDTCQGDSGSPIQVSSSDNQCIFYVIGVTSFGRRKCAQSGTPGVYTRVSSYLQWIEETVWPGE